MDKNNSITKKSDKLAWAEAKVSKIDHYKVGNLVTEMRKKGMSYMKISKELSTTYADQMDGDTISMLSVSRWCHDHMDDERENPDTTAVNAYHENIKMLHMVDDNIEMLKVFLDAVSNMIANGADDATILGLFKHIKDLQVELERYLARKQDIVGHIFNLQKEIYNMQVMNDVLNTVLTTVRRADKLIYNQVLIELRKNPRFVEATRKISDTSD